MIIYQPQDKVFGFTAKPWAIGPEPITETLRQIFKAELQGGLTRFFAVANSGKFPGVKEQLEDARIAFETNYNFFFQNEDEEICLQDDLNDPEHILLLTGQDAQNIIDGLIPYMREKAKMIKRQYSRHYPE